VKHALTASTSVFGKIGRSYRLPVVDEIYNQFGGPLWDSIVTLLRPQTSLDREIGIDFHAGAGTLRATAFRMEVDNELHYNALTFQNMNLSPTIHQGLELEGTLEFNERLSGFFNYTFTQAKFASGTYGGIDVSGKEIPLVPRHSANVGGVWRMTVQTRVSTTVSYVGEQVFDNDQDNTFGQKMPAFTTVDMKLIHDAGPWTWAFAVNNLFNEKYYTYGIRSRFTAGRYNAYPMPERNFTLSATYHF
jgi:iron complex outermembrane receptor protein